MIMAAAVLPRTNPKNGPKSRVAANPVMKRPGTLVWKCSSRMGKPSARRTWSSDLADAPISRGYFVGDYEGLAPMGARSLLAFFGSPATSPSPPSCPSD
jgi:hypothetical protein